MTRRARPWLAAVVLTVAASTLVACGTPRVAPTSPAASEPISMMPTANDFVTALIRTRDLGTAKVEIDVTTTVGEVTRELAGTGAVATDPGFGNLTWTGDAGQTHEIINDIATYVQSEPPDGIWTKLAKGDRTPTTGFADPLSGLGTLALVTNEGADDIDGVPATRYTGTLQIDPNRMVDLGLSEAEIAGIGDAWQGASMMVTAWVDAKGRVVHIDRVAELIGQDAVPVRVEVSTALSDFSGGLDLENPPSASVTEAPSGT
jgi:hypothetical protein